MIKNKLIVALTVVTTVLLSSIDDQAIAQECKAKQIMKACKSNIPKPYRYDSYAISDLVFDAKEKLVEVQFTAFQGVKYKLVFCSSGFEENVIMNVYDKNYHVKNNRHLIYDGSKEGIDNNFWTFEPPKSGNYYIDYLVPKSKDATVKTGCVVMLIGYIDSGDD